MHNFKLQSIFHPLHIHIDNFFVCFSMKKQIPSLLLKDSWLYLLYPATGWGGLAGAYNIGKSVVTYSNAYKKIPHNITFLGQVWGWGFQPIINYLFTNPSWFFILNYTCITTIQTKSPQYQLFHPKLNLQINIFMQILFIPCHEFLSKSTL